MAGVRRSSSEATSASRPLREPEPTFGERPAMKRLLLAFFFLTSSALAQDWPVKPVRVVVGYPAGGGHDFTARVVAARLTEILKQPFVVENRTGASGTIATDGIAKGPADGYSFI